MLIFRRLYLVFSVVLKFVAIVLVVGPYSSRNAEVVAQDGGFEIPVQLIGFPVIVMAVRTSNFVRKLAYALNPSTYRRSIRTIRGADSERPLDYAKADQLLVKQLGPNYCVYENVCLDYINSGAPHTGVDWTKIINEYAEVPADKKQYYLMSAFLGNIIRSKKLCQHFNETGHICNS